MVSIDHILIESVSRNLIDEKSSLVQSMAWRRTGNTPSSEPTTIHINNVYMWYSGEVSQHIKAEHCIHVSEKNYSGVIMGTMASQITSLTIIYSSVYSRLRSKKTSKLRVTGPCAGISLVTGEFPAQKVSNAENAFIWWHHHEPGHHRFENTFQLIYNQINWVKYNTFSVKTRWIWWPLLSQSQQVRNQCWIMVTWTHQVKFRWNLNRNKTIFIQEMYLKCRLQKGGHFVETPVF